MATKKMMTKKKSNIKPWIKFDHVKNEFNFTDLVLESCIRSGYAEFSISNLGKIISFGCFTDEGIKSKSLFIRQLKQIESHIGSLISALEKYDDSI